MTKVVAGGRPLRLRSKVPSTHQLIDRMGDREDPNFEKLFRKLQCRHPWRSEEEIEDAIQQTVLLAYESCTGRHEGQVYRWMSKVASGQLVDLYRRQQRETPADPSSACFLQAGDPHSEPGRALTERQHQRELHRLCRTIYKRLTPRQRQVLALRNANAKAGRREIATQLDESERTIKKDIEVIGDLTRAYVIAYAGHGCRHGERVVSRYAFGDAKPHEIRDAQLHLTACRPCSALYQALDLWRDKLPGMLMPVTAADPAQTMLERICDKAGDFVTGVRDHVADGTEHARRHVETTVQAQADRFPRVADTVSKISAVRPTQAVTVAAVCVFGVSGVPQTCINFVGSPLIDSVRGAVARAPEQTADRKKHRQAHRQRAAAPPSAPATASAASAASPEPLDHTPPPQTAREPVTSSKHTSTAKQRQASSTSAAEQEFDPAAAAAAEAASGADSPRATVQASQSTTQTSTQAPAQTSAPSVNNAAPVPADEAGLGFIGGP